MSTFLEGNRATARAIFTEGWNEGEFASLRSAFAPIFELHVHGDARSMTPADLERIVASWRQGFPDLCFELHEVVAEGDLVAVWEVLDSAALERQTSEPDGTRGSVRSFAGIVRRSEGG